MGGLNLLLVKLKMLFKKCNFLGLHQWWLISKIVAEGYVNQDVEGKNHGLIHEQSLKCLLRFNGCIREIKTYLTSPFTKFFSISKWEF